MGIEVAMHDSNLGGLADFEHKGGNFGASHIPRWTTPRLGLTSGAFTSRSTLRVSASSSAASAESSTDPWGSVRLLNERNDG